MVMGGELGASPMYQQTTADVNTKFSLWYYKLKKDVFFNSNSVQTLPTDVI